MSKYLAAILLIGGLALYVARQDEHASKHRAAETASNSHAIAAKPNENYSQKDVEDAAGNAPSWYRVFRWPDATTTWAIILTLIVIAEQTKETKRATDSQRDKDRARLLVDISDNASHADLNSIPDPVDFYWSLGIKISQQGATKAFNVVGFGTVIVRPSSETRPTISIKKMGRIADLPNIVQETHAPIEGSIYFRGIEEGVLIQISNDQQRAHFFGEIRYQDVFGASHKTSFRYIWKPEIRAPVPGVGGETFVAEEAGWQIYGKPEDNRVT